MVRATGILVFRNVNGKYEVLLSHPGGPHNARKDDWSIVKGEVDEGESDAEAARREFIEETSIEPPTDNWIDLGEAKASSKVNHIWAAEADLDISKFRCSSMATMQWPPRSGQEVTFPENDRVEWFGLAEAHKKLYKSQAVFVERLAEHLGVPLSEIIPPTNSSLF